MRESSHALDVVNQTGSAALAHDVHIGGKLPKMSRMSLLFSACSPDSLGTVSVRARWGFLIFIHARPTALGSACVLSQRLQAGRLQTETREPRGQGAGEGSGTAGLSSATGYVSGIGEAMGPL